MRASQILSKLEDFIKLDVSGKIFSSRSWGVGTLWRLYNLFLLALGLNELSTKPSLGEKIVIYHEEKGPYFPC